MLIIGIITLILISSNNIHTINEYKNIIHISILIILYMIIIIYNSISLTLINNGILILNNMIYITSYNYIIIILILILTIIYFNILENYSEYYKNSKNIKEYNILILYNILGIIIFMLSNNSILLFIAIELQSYTLYLITSTYYKNELSVGIYNGKYGLIYFILGSLASILILLGLTILYNETGLINLIDINNYIYILNNNNNNNNNYIIGIILILIGLIYKIGLSPLHNWLINIYSNVPTIITIWISIMPKISILTYILTLIIIWNNIINNIYINIFMQIIILLSMIIGCLGGLTQFNLKRILAYSGLINSSYILLTIWSNNQYSLFSYLFYIIQYSFTHYLIFMCIIYIIINNKNWLIYKRQNKLQNNNYSHNIYLLDLINILNYNKSLAFIFIICLTSFIGLPPLLGFYGKLYILISSLLSGYWLLSLLLIIMSIITAYYYGYIIKILFTSDNNNNNNIYNIIDKGEIKIYNYIMSLSSLLILCPILILDIYQNGIIIINYYILI